MGGVTKWVVVVCVGDEVEDRSVMTHDKANGQWKL